MNDVLKKWDITQPVILIRTFLNGLKMEKLKGHSLAMKINIDFRIKKIYKEKL